MAKYNKEYNIYCVKTTDSEKSPDWMKIPNVVIPAAQDSGFCNFRVAVEAANVEKLETALNEDATVIQYSIL